MERSVWGRYYLQTGSPLDEGELTVLFLGREGRVSPGDRIFVMPEVLSLGMLSQAASVRQHD